MNYGYIRVSTKEQNEDRQVLAITEWGVEPDRIYLDKQSGKDFERTQYRRMMRRLKQNDTLVVKSIDRLGRNYEEILEQWRIITKEKHADIVVLDMPLLSYVAETEREMIRQRQAEGIAAAKARGVRFGRPRLPVPEAFYVVHSQWKANEISLKKASERLGVSHQTFERWARGYELEEQKKNCCTDTAECTNMKLRK